ncbi:unnamed protein product [Brassicogethes aeneus]|uniref:Tudor domain-containing protein n=1 Tax=Brassicogethes aeneus TaxID=1431903 RepID=A0A9P0B935_BRAAE|nr:unnamed protein product [Brassicogethes aeneus]
MAARHYLKHINKKIEDLKIPDFFDKETWVCGKTYDVKVSHIYSPSVIWIVTKHRELNLFFKVMNQFYHKSYKDWSLAEEKIQKGLYCTVYVDGAFYRALVKQISLTTSGVVGIKVFLIDFGSLASVTTENIFQLKESMLKLPCFCVRASLWNIKPKHVMWQQEEINRLSELVKSASTVAIVDFIDTNLKTLRIRIGLCENNLNVTDLSEKLIKECQLNTNTFSLVTMSWKTV